MLIKNKSVVVGRSYAWCLITVVTFMRFGQEGAERCGERFTVVNWGGNASQKKGVFL